MKKVLLFAAAFVLAFSSFSQITITDSVSVGTGSPSYRLDVFYSLQNGIVDTVPNNNWHLAFATRAAQPPFNALRGATIRFNEARGVKVIKSSQSNFSTFDSTGWMGWPMMHDNDSDFTKGGLNMGTSGFNFGWGIYDMNTHHVDGSNIFLVNIGSSWKKLWVNRLAYDTLWTFTTANLDGTDSVTSTISKAGFPGKLFAYHNVLTHATIDREPSAPWELLFTRYTTFVHQFNVDTFYTVSGVLLHPSVSSARISGVDENTVGPLQAGPYVPYANTIGWDWKIAPMGPPPATWTIVDSLAFFVQQGPAHHRIVFTRFDGSSTGKIVFNKTMFTHTGVDEASQALTYGMYPNPATDIVHLSFDHNVASGNVRIFDLTGKQVVNAALNNTSEAGIGTGTLDKGLYMVVVEADGASTSRRLIIQ